MKLIDGGGSSATMLQWLSANFSTLSSSVSRWSMSDFAERSWWPEFEFDLISSSFSFVDDVIWSVIVAVETLALVSVMCFYWVFCGCTL